MAAKISKTLWKDSYYVRAYTLAKDGMNDGEIAAAIGVSISGWKLWKNDKPALRMALKQARTKPNSDEAETFMDYVYKRLSPKLREMWGKIIQLDKHRNGLELVEAVLAEGGIRARQHLFIHALVCGNFNKSEACRRVNITVATMREWIENDPQFPLLIDEIHWHKKNFFEGALTKLVRDGDTAATIFANKTFNKDWGYSEKHELEIKGEVQQTVTVKMDELDLPIEVQKRLLEAMRTKNVEVIDVPTMKELSQ